MDPMARMHDPDSLDTLTYPATDMTMCGSARVVDYVYQYLAFVALLLHKILKHATLYDKTDNYLLCETWMTICLISNLPMLTKTKTIIASSLCSTDQEYRVCVR
jgi:hypothetical protein